MINDKRCTCSQIRCFRKCARKHYINYIKGIRPAETKDYYRIGDVFHTGLDFRGKGYTVADSIVNAVVKYDDIILEYPDEYHEKLVLERELAARLLDGYFWRWQKADTQIEVLASEITFEIPVINPFTGEIDENFVISGKIDKIIKLADGRIALMEHKTTSDDIDPTSNYWKRLRLDIQISIYYLAAKKLGYDVETIVYDVTRKPPITKPKQLSQRQTKQLIETGTYTHRFFGDEKSTDIGQYSVQYKESEETVYINGSPTKIIKAPKGFSIFETVAMYGDRITNDIARRHEFYFSRREIPRLQADLDQIKQDLWDYSQMLLFCDKNNIWPKNDDACLLFGECPYFDLCSSGFDFEDVPEGFIQLKNVHTELTV